MNNILAVLTGTLMSDVWLVPVALAQTACVAQNMAIPAGANTHDKAAPFCIDTTGLDFKTAPGDSLVRRVAMMFDPSESGPFVEGELGEAEKAAASFGLELSVAQVRGAAEIERAIALVTSQTGGGLLVRPRASGSTSTNGPRQSSVRR
jgi:hypothetical protein